MILTFSQIEATNYVTPISKWQGAIISNVMKYKNQKMFKNELKKTLIQRFQHLKALNHH